jgi:hypothetical protein
MQDMQTRHAGREDHRKQTSSKQQMLRATAEPMLQSEGQRRRLTSGSRFHVDSDSGSGSGGEGEKMNVHRMMHATSKKNKPQIHGLSANNPTSETTPQHLHGSLNASRKTASAVPSASIQSPFKLFPAHRQSADPIVTDLGNRAKTWWPHLHQGRSHTAAAAAAAAAAPYPVAGSASILSRISVAGDGAVVITRGNSGGLFASSPGTASPRAAAAASDGSPQAALMLPKNSSLLIIPSPSGKGSSSLPASPKHASNARNHGQSSPGRLFLVPSQNPGYTPSRALSITIDSDSDESSQDGVSVVQQSGATFLGQLNQSACSTPRVRHPAYLNQRPASASGRSPSLGKSQGQAAQRPSSASSPSVHHKSSHPGSVSGRRPLTSPAGPAKNVSSAYSAAVASALVYDSSDLEASESDSPEGQGFDILTFPADLESDCKESALGNTAPRRPKQASESAVDSTRHDLALKGVPPRKKKGNVQAARHQVLKDKDQHKPQRRISNDSTSTESSSGHSTGLTSEAGDGFYLESSSSLQDQPSSAHHISSSRRYLVLEARKNVVHPSSQHGAQQDPHSQERGE